MTFTKERFGSFPLSPRKMMITKLTLACSLFAALLVGSQTARSEDLGINLVPDDAAFVASTLRGRE